MVVNAKLKIRAMKIKNRYGWHLRFPTIRSKAMRRLGKDPNEFNMGLGEWIIVAGVLLFNFDIIPASIPYHEELRIIMLALFTLVGGFAIVRRKAPRRRWTNASWATGVFALVLTVSPWILYHIGELSRAEAIHINIIAGVAWLIFIACILRLRYIRRRSKQTIALLRMRQKRRRAEY